MGQHVDLNDVSNDGIFFLVLWMSALCRSFSHLELPKSWLGSLTLSAALTWVTQCLMTHDHVLSGSYCAGLVVLFAMGFGTRVSMHVQATVE